MAWTASGGFRQYFADIHNGVLPATRAHLGLETHKVALFNNSVTPDFDATAANTAYNAGTWTNATNEVSGTGYTAGGTALTTTTVSTVAGGIMMWDADDTSWTTATFSNAYGCLIYADGTATGSGDPVTDQGICAVYFGGAFQVTSGTFTIQWSANGILRLDVA